ncbi:DUF3304 domain-containing protein [Ralstonia wenshanensis]|uniref:DUF3304 domain-containing protein n=1 Tax=Ralstonia wenshanensis TaxID=2842456 RepID=UPI002930F09C|nr:DUF3304 domain-containing protein [Ralstonia wenshanensis]
MKEAMLSIPTRLRHYIGLLVLVGCAIQSPAGAMDIAGINYTDIYVSLFTVNGYPGPNVMPHGGGGKFVCCISVPEVWKPGMTVTVKWTDKRNANPIPWKTRVVEVPQYSPDERGVFVVHFFPNDEVKVLVTRITVGHQNYPFPDPTEYRQK